MGDEKRPKPTVRSGNYLMVGQLTGQVYLVRRWREHPDGLREAIEKVDVTEQFDSIAALRAAWLTDDATPDQHERVEGPR